MRRKEGAKKVLPSWVVEEGICGASSHEPLKFYRRMGDNPRWREEWYFAHRTEEFAKKMSDAGFNHINLALFKGFGLEEEHDEIEDLAKRIPIFQKHGIRVRSYIQFGSVMRETIQKEIPNVADWCKRNSAGEIITYRWGNQDWRWRPCHNRPEFIAYLKKCVDRAVEIGVDAIGFDNVKQGWAGDYHDFCYCELCRGLFRDYLQERFAERQDLVGISSFDYVEPPTVHHPEEVICQSWLRFQDERLYANVKELYDYAKSKNPDVLMNANGLPAHVDGACSDTAMWEGHIHPRIEDDEIVCAAQAYKHGNDRGVFVYAFPALPFTEEEAESSDSPNLRTLKLGIAYASACGGHGVFVPAIDSKMRGVQFPLDKSAFANSCKTYFEFLKKHRPLFHPAESISKAAIYLNWPSWNLDHQRVQSVFQVVEQVFLRNHVLFDIFYMRDLAEIRSYDFLVFPDIKCVSDEELEALSAFKKGGGKIAALGETACYDEFFRERLEPGLGDTIQLPDNALEAKGWRSFPRLMEFLCNDDEHLKTPVAVKAPDTLIVEGHRIDSTNTTIVSLLNFDAGKRAKDVELAFAAKDLGEEIRASWATPDREEADLESLPISRSGDRITINVPEVDIYAFVALTNV